MKRTKNEIYYVITPMMEPSPKYKDFLTKKGLVLWQYGPNIEDEKLVYFAFFEKLDVPISAQSNPKFWNELNDANLFCNWKEGGPLGYKQNSKDNPTIGLFRVFETSLPFSKIEKRIKWQRRRIFGELPPQLLDRQTIQHAKPVISDADYILKKKTIMKIINKYRN